MAGFPLGGGSHSRENPPPPVPPVPSDTATFLYGGRGGHGAGGFQLWQQQQEQQQQQFYAPSIIRFADDAPAGPSSAAAASRGMRAGGSGGGGGCGGGVSCQDCGNQAKKDCIHLRCRTCCKSRGFACPTHVKSTWVPAAKRRERQQQLAALAASAAAAATVGPSRGSAGEPSKRPRDARGQPSTTTPTTSSGDQQMMAAEQFPREVSSEAVFRCVRLGPVDEADAEVAYQTAVSIGGHVFKGILHDVGTDPSSGGAGDYHLRHAGEWSSPSTAAPGAITGSGEAGGGNVVVSSAVVMDPYPTPGPFGAFGAGTPFFHSHPRS